MRAIERATAFKRDYKREAKGRHRATLDSDLRPVLVALLTDQPLGIKYRDRQPPHPKGWGLESKDTKPG